MDETTPDVPPAHLTAAADLLRDEGYDVTFPVPGVLHVTGRFQNPERIALRAAGRLGDNPGAVWAVGTTNDWALVGWNRPDLVTITQRGAAPQRWRHRRIPSQLHPRRAGLPRGRRVALRHRHQAQAPPDRRGGGGAGRSRRRRPGAAGLGATASAAPAAGGRAEAGPGPAAARSPAEGRAEARRADGQGLPHLLHGAARHRHLRQLRLTARHTTAPSHIGPVGPPIGPHLAERRTRRAVAATLVRSAHRLGWDPPLPAPPARFPTSRSWWFDLAVFAAGLAVLVATLAGVARDGFEPSLLGALGVPLIVLVARFPMVIDSRDGGIEVGFDSCILMFLLCTLDAHDALLVWSVGVILTQLLTGKRWTSKVFNIGVGIAAGGLASTVLTAVRGDTLTTPRELGAVLLAASAYFATDYVTSAVSVAIDSATPVQRHLLQRGTLIAVAGFVPFDTLGYLGAVVHRSAPEWMLVLLAVPLVTLLVATWGVNRSRENARRLNVLFAAAVRAQTLDDQGEVLDALAEDARELLHLKRVHVRPTPPGRNEVGAEVHGGTVPLWVVAKALDRARSTVTADEEALRALAAVASDALARLALTREMVHVARHDPLTDLPNRGILLDRLTDALAAARRDGTGVALLFVDLDMFKPVNDRFGHAAGDTVLVELAGRLRSCVRSTDTVARLGGDEFAVLFEDADPRRVHQVWDRLLRAVQAGVVVSGEPVRLGASAGIAYAEPGDRATDLLRKADLAMYEAKARGKARVVEYEDAIGHSRLERLALVEDLRDAVAAEQIEVVYQPVVEAGTGRIIGAEALARWQRDGSPVAPDVFIKVAEETDLIVDLGEVVLARVAADAVTLRSRVAGDFLMGANISARQLSDPSFVDTVRRTTQRMGDVGLVLEITERQGIEIDATVLASMHAVAAMGVQIAIDDFGTGFSSISYLHDLPVHFIKADASLSQGIDTDERAAALLRSVTLMGRSLGLGVVVEGIERESQLAVLRADTDGLLAQGYLLHRPMPLADLLTVLRPWPRLEVVPG
ncbi:EAL domain-containing protein [Nocardioides sp. TF02-7]|uniref:putative bifunctional diguanylate cyclase/phosphodiesterase n=1 Tax=Nocardioides sp. TF02-7 TaxID=2917724 RepID=UPI001F0522F5|nr:EAL domain-containing protein [Nocardioides sp. TF02-7]UMG93550.1 EAL domain-containing protein [Nocardioides sp. TF02-7]